MIFTETKLKGAFVIELERREDERGFFARSFCQHEFARHESHHCSVRYCREIEALVAAARGGAPAKDFHVDLGTVEVSLRCLSFMSYSNFTPALVGWRRRQ